MEQELFILWSTEVPLTNQIYRYEGDAQQAAETIARNCRGAVIHMAKIIASISEPLPDLKWSDGRMAGSGKNHVNELTGTKQMGLETPCNTVGPVYR